MTFLWMLAALSRQVTGLFVGMTYEAEDGTRGGVLLQAKNDKYRALLETLKAVTGKEVDTEEKEKK